MRMKKFIVFLAVLLTLAAVESRNKRSASFGFRAHPIYGYALGPGGVPGSYTIHGRYNGEHEISKRSASLGFHPDFGYALGASKGLMAQAYVRGHRLIPKEYN